MIWFGRGRALEYTEQSLGEVNRIEFPAAFHFLKNYKMNFRKLIKSRILKKIISLFLFLANFFFDTNSLIVTSCH